MSRRIRSAFFILGCLAIGQVIWWAYLLISQQNLIAHIALDAADKTQRFKTMVLFEGTFFIFFWGLSLFWLYRSYFSHLHFKTTKDNFLGAISHELKTPIANVQLCLETLQRPQIDSIKRQNYISKALQALSQLSSLVETILTLTTANHFKETEKLVNLREFAIQVLNKIEYDSTKNNIEIQIQENQYLTTNAMATELILKNLIENSIKYSKDKNSHILVSSYQQESSLILEVQDNGIGMDKSEIQKVFEPFWRSPRAALEAKPGTGIGLTLSSELARKNKMRLSAESDGIDQGSKFKITWDHI